MDPETRLSDYLKANNLELPPPPKVIGLYKPAITVGNLCYTSGHLPIRSDGTLFQGAVGGKVDQETGFQAARQSGLAMLSTLKSHLGSLNRVQQVVKLLGLVNCIDGYESQPAVVNGCSELMKVIFGDDAGVGARSAVGVNSLPLDVTVEIEGVFLVDG